MRVPPVIAAATVALALCALPAAAQTSAGVEIDGAIAGLRDALVSYGGALADSARQLMLGLLVLDMVWRAARWMVRGEGADTVVEGLLYQIGFVGLAWGLVEVVPQVVDFLAATARRLASSAGATGGFSPSGMVADGLGTAGAMLRNVSLNPGTWFYLAAALVSVLVVAMGLAMIVVVYAEFYIAGLAGILALAFAGLQGTRDIAVNYVRSLIGKAFKLLALMVIMASTGELTRAFSGLRGWDSFDGAMIVMLLQLVNIVLILTLPGSVEALVGGPRSSGAGEALGSKAAVATATVGTVAASGAAGGASGAIQRGLAARAANETAGGIARAAMSGAAGGAVDWGGAVAGSGLRGAIRERLASRGDGG